MKAYGIRCSGAGVAPTHLADLERRLVADRNSVGKYDIARTVINRINAEGDSGLRTCREIVRRVVDWRDFSTCWPKEALQAQGLVAKVKRGQIKRNLEGELLTLSCVTQGM